MDTTKLKKKLLDIREYFESLEKLGNIPFVFPDQLLTQDLSKVKVILVGDNPGAKEMKYKEFFSKRGSAGKIAHAFFDGVFGQESFAETVLVLNKTLFHTNRTNELRAQFKTPEMQQLLVESQHLLAQFILEFLQQKNIPVIIVGFSEMDGLFREFFQALAFTPQNDNIALVPHFSMSKFFCKNSNDPWNKRIDAFLARHPEIATPNGNCSSKTLLSASHEILSDYFEHVIMKQKIEHY
jgi:hypothetical protein